jgi:hypothetical protein
MNATRDTRSLSPAAPARFGIGRALPDAGPAGGSEVLPLPDEKRARCIAAFAGATEPPAAAAPAGLVGRIDADTHPCTTRTAPDAACRMLRPALAYAEKGWPVFPCRPDKKPATPHGFKDASADRKTIAAWWTANPASMIGMPTGDASGLVVVDLDLDPAKGLDGPAEFSALVKTHGAPICTRKHSTPRGGMHLVFKHPGEKVKSTTSALAPGVDTRGDGGYVIVPPSQNGSGPYTVETDVAPAPLPAWLIGLFRERGIMAGTTRKAPMAESTPSDATDRAKVQDALRFVSADCPFDAWLRVGMALHSWNSTDGYGLWDAWSRTAPDRYEEGAIERHWRTFKPGPVTTATLFKLATDAGWKPTRTTTRRRSATAGAPPPEHSTAAAPSVSVESNGKPPVLLPHGAQSISDTGRALGVLLARTERFFLRGGAVVKLAMDPDGLPHLEDVRPAALASDFETVAAVCKPGKPDKDGRPGPPEPATCPEQTAKLIAASAAFRDAMRPIHVLTRCPVLIERAGSLIQVSGYDRASGILAAGDAAEPMDVAEARRLLSEILAGFRFATPADRARALAAMITPALVFGGLLRGRAPVDLGEADASQTGKGYRNKLTAALYGQSIKAVTQQRAGVGSMEESFNMALIRGANFIALDNVRGKIDSPSFESFLTEDTYHARAPYREPVEVDPRRVVIMLTSNKADVTPDLANRCTCVRLLKQPEGHTFTAYPEGDILEHVRANQPRYLGAVFAIVRAWHEAGKPRTAETRHDFCPWAQTLDWITRNLLDAGPLLDGHRETQARMTNPVLNWLRDVAIDVIRDRKAGAWLRASDLVDVIAESGTETPGLPEHGDLTDPETRENAQRATGRKLGLCFRPGDMLTLDGMTVERREWHDPARFKTVKEYRFTGPPIDGERMGGNTKPTPASAQLDFPEPAARPVSAHRPAHAPPIDPPMKPLIPPIPPMTPPKCEHGDAATQEEGGDIDSMGTYGRMGGTAALAAVEIEEGEI